jgi:signal transduction histidine kinase/ligand-binding sensor domain-containing protein/AraC-like DNA-binding protein
MRIKNLKLLFCLSLTGILPAAAQNAQFSYHISNHNIQAFAQDADGYIWMGTARGLNRYNGTNYAIFYAGSGEEELNSNNILSLCLDSTGRLWTGTECGIGYYEHGRFYHYANAVYNPTSQILELDSETVVGMGKDGPITFRKDDINTPVARYYAPGMSWNDNALVSAGGDLWIPRISGDSTYVDVLDKGLRLLEEFYLGQGLPVVALAERPAHTIWVATGRGIRCFDGRSRTAIPTPQPLAELVAGEHMLFLLPYKENNLLLGLAGKGLFSYNTQAGSVMQVVPEQHLSAPEYICFVDRDDNIWLSDKQSDLRFYADRRPYTHLSPGENPLLAGRLSNLAFDREGFLWMRAADRFCSLDPETGRVLWISPEPVGSSGMIIDATGRLCCLSADRRTVLRYRLSGGKAFPDRTIRLDGEAFSISEDAAGQLWLSLNRRLAVINPDGRTEYRPGPEGAPFTLTLSDPESRRVFLFTVTDRLYEILPDRTFRRIGDTSLASTDFVTVGHDGTLWCGTYNDGIIRYNEHTGAVDRFDSSSGMAATNIKSIVEDNDGRIWFSTSEHITRFDPVRGIFSTLHDDRFSGGRFYDLVSCAKGPDGRLYFGGTGGITVIDPATPVPERGGAPLFFEYIAVNGAQKPTGTQSLLLSWRENNLDFRFSGIDFEAGSLLSYAYMLEGFDRDWQYRSSNVQAAYAQVPAGHYVFRARVREQDGSWSSAELHLPVTIRPAPWASWWAWALYVLLGLGLAGGAVWFLWRIRKQRSQLAMAKQREEMKQQHIDFVTNISHEFRTPLSMIYAPVKELAKHPLDERDRQLVDTISRNAERLRGLSEQILSTQGGRQEHEALRIRQNDLVSIVNNMVGNFAYAAGQKHQTLRADLPESLIGWFDTEKVSKILGNLISNAIKYTPEEGHITVRLVEDGQQARIDVEDNGIGIPEDKRERIFERFDRLGAESTGVIGSGIGLNYARGLAGLHKGTLSFMPNGEQGSVFTLQIPIHKDAYHDISIDETEYRPITETPADDGGEKEGTILIAEDTNEIRYFLRELFAPRYRVILAPDGLEAEENLKLALPDLVLSDVIIPGKTGYALCADIKENPEWCHIPVILLTAKADAQSNIEGMRHGADAYIPKPFDPDVLMAAVESQIRNRRLIQNRVLNLTSTTIKEPDKAEEAHLSASDRAMIDRIHAWLDANLDNELVGVQEMARELSMSYSSLYAKLKGLTGKTPQAFMANYRMNIALELLQAGELNVSEVAYRVGSSSPSTFSREFKKHFGFPPSQVPRT